MNVLTHTIVQVITKDQMGLALTDAQAMGVSLDHRLQAEFALHGLDSETVTHIVNFVSRLITGQPWPCYGDPADQRQAFRDRYERLAKEKGFSLLIASTPAA